MWIHYYYTILMKTTIEFPHDVVRYSCGMPGKFVLLQVTI